MTKAGIRLGPEIEVVFSPLPAYSVQVHPFNAVRLSCRAA